MTRPKISIQPTKTDWVIELIGLFGIIFVIVFVMTSYNQLPDTIPRHYNATGEPDGFSGKSILFVQPMVTVATYLVLTIGLRFPHIFNYPVEIIAENAERQYRNAILLMRVIKTLIVIMFGYLTYATIQTGLGKMHGLGIWFAPVFLVVILGAVGFFVYRAFRLR